MAAGLLEDRAPGVFGVAEDRAHEFGLFIVGRRCLTRLRSGGRLFGHLPGELAEDLQRVLPGDPADADDQQDRPKAQPLAAAEAHTATTAHVIATGVDDVVTASAFFP